MRRGLAEARDAMSRRDATLRASAGRATCRSFLHLADIFSETPSATRGCRDAATVKNPSPFRGGKQRDASLTSMAQGEARCLLCETPLGARGTFTAGCCGGRFHEKCVVHHCGQQGARAPGEVRIAPCRDIHRHVSGVTRRLASPHPPLVSDPRDIPPFPAPGTLSLVRRAVAQARFRGPRAPLHLLPATHPLRPPGVPPVRLGPPPGAPRDPYPLRPPLRHRPRARQAPRQGPRARRRVRRRRRVRLGRAHPPRRHPTRPPRPHRTRPATRAPPRETTPRSRVARHRRTAHRIAHPTSHRSSPSRAHRARGRAGRVPRAVVRRDVRAVPRPRVEEPVRARVSGTRREEARRKSVGRRREGDGPPAAQARGSRKGTAPVQMRARG